MPISLKGFLYLFLFVVLTVAVYAMSLIDHSVQYLPLLRIMLMGLCYLYFLSFIKYLYTQQARVPEKKQAGAFYAFVLFFLHMLGIAIVTDHLNAWLIRTNHKETMATIEYCYTSKGSEYCIYSYRIGQTYYERKYNNEPEALQLNTADTATILYYPLFPAISKLKNESD